MGPTSVLYCELQIDRIGINVNLHLYVQFGPDQGMTFRVEPGETILIGRGRNTKTGLTDPRASRKHCQLAYVDGRITLEDVGSSAGTFLNGEKISDTVEVDIDDVIRVGRTEIAVKAGDEADASLRFSIFQILASPEQSVDEFQDPLIGQTLDDLHIERRLAQGPNGTVYYATHVESGDPRAVKVLSSEVLADERSTKRLMRGMQTMEGIHHPNIVQIHGVGQEGDLVWVSMEYVEGQSAADIVDSVTPDSYWRSALEIGLYIARALTEAAAHNIVHRKINPKNVLVRESDGVALLGDLMLAKCLDSDRSGSLSSEEYEVLEDLTYEPPEATFGIKNLDMRSDIYSLGAVLFATLTGRPPFAADYVPDLIQQLRESECPRPSELDVELPRDFEAVLMKMLDKQPDDRYQHPDELLKELMRVARQNRIDMPWAVD